MTSTGARVNRAGQWDENRLLLFPLANTLLLLSLAVLYGGALRYLAPVSSLALYSFYAVLFGCIALSLLTSRGNVTFHWPSVLPYLAWLSFYLLWGTLFSRDQDSSVREMARFGYRNALILTTFVVALVNRRSLERFAGFAQVAVLVNAGVSLWLALDPLRMARLAFYLDPNSSSYSLRPSGLWINPNEASFAFLFGLLLSRWARGRWVWAARGAALLGIFLSASRTGFLMALLCGAVFLIYRFRTSRPMARILGIILGITLLLGVRAGWLVDGLAPLNIDVGQQTALQRLTDLTETETERERQLTRAQLTRLGLTRLIQAPWYGNGLLAFQGGASAARIGLPQGIHNIYLAVGGEVGWLGLFTYLGVLALGVRRLLRARVAVEEKLVLVLFWTCYLLIGLTWHNQLTSIGGAIYSGMLFHLPYLLDKEDWKGAVSSRNLPAAERTGFS